MSDEAAASPQAQRFDVCIIGAGAAGLVLAEILSRETSLQICIVEAGPDHFRDRKEPFRVRSLLREHVGVNTGLVTAFGGATNTWGGGLIRLSPADFEALEGRPDTAWPIPFDEIVPHYAAIESLFGIVPSSRGPDRTFCETDACVVRRRDIPILPFRRKNFAKAFGPLLRSRSNVTILCDTQISAIEPDGAGGVRHLLTASKDGVRRRIAAQRFVVSAGIVNTNLLGARVLSACGVAPAAVRQGRFFHDHVSFPIARLHPKSPGRFSRRFGYLFENGLMYGEHFDLESRGARRPGAFLHLAFDMSESSILRPVRDLLNVVQQRTLNPKSWPSWRELASLTIGLPRLGFMRYLGRRLYLDRGTKILATIDLEQTPIAEWMIQQASDQCAVTWDVAPSDIDLAARLMPTCRQIIDRLGNESPFEIEWLVPDPAADPDGFAAHLRLHAVDTLHSSGGLRMGATREALVDPDLRLAGVGNVHILSTAVFPRVGTSNPTLTILALGHRLAQHLLREVGQGEP